MIPRFLPRNVWENIVEEVMVAMDVNQKLQERSKMMMKVAIDVILNLKL